MLTLLKNQTVYLDDVEYTVVHGSPTEDTLLENQTTGERLRASTDDLVAKYLTGHFRTAAQRRAQLKQVSTSSTDSVRFKQLTELSRKETHRRIDYVTQLERSSAFLGSRESLQLEISKVAAARGEPRAPTASTVYRWRKKYLAAAKDVRALIAGFDNQGGRGKSRLDTGVERVIDEAIEAITLNQRRSSAHEVHEAVRLEVDRVNQCMPDDSKLKTPSLRTVQRRVGLVGALDLEIAQTSPPFAKRKFTGFGRARSTTRLLELVEIDHTPADIVVVDENRKTIGRPDMTIVLERRTRCVVGFHLSLAGHGVPAVFAALRHALLPKTYLQVKYADMNLTWDFFGWFERVLMDNGTEFHAEAVADALLSLGVASEFAPSREPNAKPFVERFNRRINYELIHTLPGATLSHHHKRKGFDPYKEASLTLEELDRICHKWICDSYHRRPHRGLGMRSPAEAWAEEAKKWPPQLKMNKEDIDIEFCEITTSRVQHYGIDLNTFQFDSPQLQNLRASLPRGAKVTVKWPRHDVGYVWIWDPINQEFFKAPNRKTDYQGVTLEQAKAISAKQASADAKADLHPARADEQVREMAAQAVHSTKQAQRRKDGRLANRTSKHARESAPVAAFHTSADANPPKATTAAASPNPTAVIPDVEIEMSLNSKEGGHDH